MKIVSNFNPRKIVSIIREISGEANFITILSHDGEIKLNDPGDIAIPSRTKTSRSLDLHKNNRQLILEIIDFLRGAK